MCRRRILQIAIACVAVLSVGQVALAENDAKVVSAASPGDSYLYLFDPDTSAFEFAFEIPETAAGAWDVDVLSFAASDEIWVTEPGIDRIGCLVYTDTTSYEFQQYALPAGSAPLNLEIDGDYVWYTAPGRNSVGRLHRTTHTVDEFAVPTLDAYPADLDIAEDGSVWFTEMYADQVAQLVVTSTVDFEVTEYAGPTMAGGRPYGVLTNNINSGGQSVLAVYIAQTVNDRITRFTPYNDRWLDLQSPNTSGGMSPDGPYELAVDSRGKVWGTERDGNAVSNYEYGTYAIVNVYPVTPTLSLPHSLVLDSSDRVWLTQSNAGQLGRVVLGGTVQKDYYPLPSDGASPRGIAVDDQDNVWLAAVMPYRVYVPLVIRAYSGTD